MPGGVNSPVRAFKNINGNPIFFEKAQGAYLHDADGNKYIDFIGSWGPMIMGHSHPDIVNAIKKQADLGTSYGAPTSLENDVAIIPLSKIVVINGCSLFSYSRYLYGSSLIMYISELNFFSYSLTRFTILCIVLAE